MVRALSEKGYAETTIADVVRAARVSKRTFYEHYPDKETCFLAAYGHISDDLLAQVARAADDAAVGEPQIEAAVRAYFTALDAQPALLRPFLLDIHAAGPNALALRRAIHRRFAELLRTTVERARRTRKDLRPLSLELAIALVGGINELILSTLEDARPRRVSALAKPAIVLLRAVVLARA